MRDTVSDNAHSEKIPNGAAPAQNSAQNPGYLEPKYSKIDIPQPSSSSLPLSQQPVRKRLAYTAAMT